MYSPITFIIRTVLLVACIVSPTVSPVSVLGSILVDSFQTPQHSDDLERRVTAPEALGGTRFLATSNGAALVSEGCLVFDQPWFAGHVSVAYDANGLGLGPIDVTEGGSLDALQVTVASCSLPGRLLLRMKSDLLGAAASGLYLTVQPSALPIAYALEFSGFDTSGIQGPRGPATLTSVQGISLRFESDLGSDPGQIVLTDIRLVPEPAGLAMAVLVAMILSRIPRTPR